MNLRGSCACSKKKKKKTKKRRNEMIVSYSYWNATTPPCRVDDATNP